MVIATRAKLERKLVFEDFHGRPMQSDNISWLQARLPRLGMAPDCTFYSARTETSTKTERSAGIVTTKKAIDHKIGGSTFYEHSDKGLDHFDATGLMVEDGNCVFLNDGILHHGVTVFLRAASSLF